jgi:hypothetical protein
MRLSQREECESIAEIIGAHGGAGRRWNNIYLACRASLSRKITGRQTKNVM